MRRISSPIPTITGKNFLSLLFLASLFISMAVAASAQIPQLSLADLVIALRSKKATLPERNKILTEAVRERGITFALTTDIEKELSTTGADPELLTAIRTKSPAPKPVEVPKPVATPVPTPTPPDFTFYQKRADERAGKGEFTSALADYDKAIEMKATDPVIFLGRGKTQFNLKSYDLSIVDFDKSITLNPKASMPYFNRAAAYEKLGNTQKAMADYQAAIDLDATNEAAKSNLRRLQDEAAKIAAAEAAAKVAKRPEFVAMGSLTAATATRMVTPTYSPLAQRANIEGRV
ncbi:MAG TPA: tetratricopeptide repeat protein, partial [Pyrinomonadaceae bacterium]|nr:tetratricopeptide repeat protein [Pyrinomonadaceae bacterium]